MDQQARKDTPMYNFSHPAAETDVNSSIFQKAFQHLKQLCMACSTGSEYIDSDSEYIYNPDMPNEHNELGFESSNFYNGSLTSNSFNTSVEALSLDYSLSMPHADTLLKLSNISTTEQFAEEKGSIIQRKEETKRIKVPFAKGFFSILYGTSRTPFLHAQYADCFMSDSEAPISIEIDNENAKKSMKLAEKNFPEAFEQFINFLRGPNVPMSVLLHHIMLYDLYSPRLKDAIWETVGNYLQKMKGSYGYTDLHVKVARYKLTHPRFIMIHPEEIFCVYNNPDWVCVSNKHFHCNIHIQPIVSNAMKSSDDRIREVASNCQTPVEYGWLTLGLALRKKAAIFPIHAYLNCKTKLYDESMPPSLLYYLKEDENTNTSNIEEIINYMYEIFNAEAALCGSLNKNKDNINASKVEYSDLDVDNIKQGKGEKVMNPFEPENVAPVGHQ
ncbi:hypothetical protein SPOG_04504 [Schizosaccharomyces cryophilus OY26]|uniref:Uncharacterized protein n=1 Tax=Schizosaccharomyces cryophilus (strain OY26 / ATCC MYA-4695 / CBS 11777 / NBRC 106824 / NRRL Y48691) TaxID=653667 RepID=S9W4P5_SCHCR|nr:uncharacterized protein SPOG_04504 [Schizosaccharomyces cryophilus OY26]EPY53494.1 hypothetical protein SPOG_04504 [Schizosaccharomyces cryophilus OY26]